MDVVRSNLERLGGQLEINSEIGKGSTFRIKLPLTLAIIPSLIISVGRDRFAIPQINVSELLRVRPEEIAKRLDVVGDAQVLLRDQVLPLVRLDSLLGVREVSGSAPEALGIAVVTTGSQQYALVVSSFHGTEEIVVKPLGRHLKGLSEYAGATILGDGAVALILDVAGVATKARLATVSQERDAASDEQLEGRHQEDLHSLLLFHNAPDEVCAVSLGTVLRIERATSRQIERVGSRRTIQYRGASLPLVTLSDAAQVNALSDTADLAVVVFGINGREVGLLGAMPVDVVETNAPIDQVTHRQKGISGSAIIRNQTTLLVDVFELVEAVYPEWATRPVPSANPDGALGGKTHLLLAEDSDFFRSQIRKHLEQDGFDVIEAPDGEAAWEQLQAHGDEIQIVVTDIEMPRLTGLGLTARIRGTERFSQLPIIALSSLAGEDDIAKGIAAGVTQYQVKLDRDRLISGIHECLGKS